MDSHKERIMEDQMSSGNSFTVALAGNPNVGKSTVFNALTGLRQHTGNWPGKTVERALGYFHWKGTDVCLVDLPGTYSLMAHSKEEEIAGNYLCFGEPDAVVVVCDATCLERNLLLVLQILQITDQVVLCVNLMDEAKKKKINIDLLAISAILGIPVVGAAARRKQGLNELMEETVKLCGAKKKKEYQTKEKAMQREKTAEGGFCTADPVTVMAQETDLNGMEEVLNSIEIPLKEQNIPVCNTRWLAFKLLEQDELFLKSLNEYMGTDLLSDKSLSDGHWKAENWMKEKGIGREDLTDYMVRNLVHKAEEIYHVSVTCQNKDYTRRDRNIDRILTNKWTGIPVMLLLLAGIFWLTITGANVPSELLSQLLFGLEEKMMIFFMNTSVPPFLYEMFILGMYRVVAWVVSVMLPPMAIFFPLFTLLEDSGYLPRIAFNLDRCFKKCCACGKQALTMCMGFGCNAAGIVGCRIIDSKRERLLAVLTNNFVPCNGRFPILIAVIAMFFAGTERGAMGSVLSASILMLVVLLGIGMTFLVSKLLSMTILKGIPSSFTLELPPYRRPCIGKILVRSILDRTLFVLGRAVAVAAPAGILIWLLANINVHGMPLLSHAALFLDPAGRLIGLDGVILLAFILGIPANEIVIPVMLMTYMASGSLMDYGSLDSLKQILIDNGWTWMTAVSMLLFSLFHWPCSTTCLTIKKETGSIKWTFIAFLIPTLAGFLICFLFNLIGNMSSYVF